MKDRLIEIADLIVQGRHGADFLHYEPADNYVNNRLYYWKEGRNKFGCLIDGRKQHDISALDMFQLVTLEVERFSI